MENKHELTEKLKVIETEIYNDKIDLRGINSKLEMAYKYEEELIERMNYAKKQTEELRKQFFIKAGEISTKYDKMKNIFDVFTGNFYKH
jgi:hypothetical protein